MLNLLSLIFCAIILIFTMSRRDASPFTVLLLAVCVLVNVPFVVAYFQGG